MKRFFVTIALCALLAPCASALADNATLTNSDVVRMAHSGISDSVLATMVRSKPGKYDLSPDAIIRLKKAGAGDQTVRAMLEADAPSAHAAAQAGTPNAPAPAARVTFMDGTKRHDLPVATTHVAQTQMDSGGLSSGADIGTLSGVAGSALSMIPGVGMLGALGSLGGMFGHKQHAPQMHQVWALEGPRAPTTVSTSTPTFEVSYANISGLDPERFAPALVRLVPTKDNWRIVGASKSSLGASQNTTDGASGIPIDSIDEQRIAARVDTLARGRARVTPQAPLANGEYAVVLRPVDAKDASDGEASAQSLSSVIASVWDFSIAGAATASTQ